MPTEYIEGNRDAKGATFALVGARWHPEYTDSLIQAAVETLKESGCGEQDITVVRAPGCYELPFVCQKLAQSGNYSAVIAVGTLIKGETAHFDLVAADVSSGLSRVMLDTGVPVTFGVITADTYEQAANRSGESEMNKGREAALAAVELTNLLKKL